ncbi:hypothetical protein DERF_005645 [Dermatophagoides farinae]|nr:hypothetical protein DERF_005645 [Dermatophagoides farinae]
MISKRNKRRKLKKELETIDVILNELSQQRKLLEDRLQQVYCRKFLQPVSVVEDQPSDDVQIPVTKLPKAKSVSEQFPSTSSSLIQLDLSVPDSFKMKYQEEEEDDDDEEMENDDADIDSTDNKEKLRKLFAQLQQF